MTFEYIKAIGPSPARAPLELAPILPVNPTGAESDLAELVAHALEQTREVSLACPTPPEQRLDLPWFSGITLADTPLPPMPPMPPADEPEPSSATVLGPGAMTMMLAAVATLAFGVFVVTH